MYDRSEVHLIFPRLLWSWVFYINLSFFYSWIIKMINILRERIVKIFKQLLFFRKSKVTFFPARKTAISSRFENHSHFIFYIGIFKVKIL